MRLNKLANWLSEGDLDKYQQEAQQAAIAEAKVRKIESELEALKDNLQETEKELAQTKAQLQINQGFQVELGETQLKLQKVNGEAQRYKKELFENQKQLNLMQSQLRQARQTLTRAQNWTEQLQVPILVQDIQKTLPKQEFDTLWGFGVFTPQVKFVITTGALHIKGWVLGKKAAVETVKLVYQTTKLLETTAQDLRPRISEQYPDIPNASKCGFEMAVSVSGIPSAIELNLVAVLHDKTSVPLCAIALRTLPIESEST